MSKFYEIKAYPKHNDRIWLYDHVERRFTNTPDLSTSFFTREAAEYFLEEARAAWNDLDAVEVVEVGVDCEGCDE